MMTQLAKEVLLRGSAASRGEAAKLPMDDWVRNFKTLPTVAGKVLLVVNTEQSHVERNLPALCKLAVHTLHTLTAAAGVVFGAVSELRARSHSFGPLLAAAAAGSGEATADALTVWKVCKSPCANGTWVVGERDRERDCPDTSV